MTMAYDYEYDDRSDCDSESSSVFEEDMEQVDNARRHPDWQGLRSLLKLRGCCLDTAADVRHFYEKYWQDNPGSENKSCREYQRACSLPPSALCRDPGLVRCYVRRAFRARADPTSSLTTLLEHDMRRTAQGS